MARTLDSAKRVINGTYGEVWVDGEKIAECTACQAKVAKQKETIRLCGQFMSDTKATGADGTGSLTLYHVDSGFLQRQRDLQSGVDCTVIAKLRDPDSYGAERVALYNVSFDDLTLADWAAAAVGTITAPFTFSRYELLDEIEVQ